MPVSKSLLFSLIMTPKFKSSGVGNSEMTKRGHKVLSLSEKVCAYREKHSIYRVHYHYYPQFEASTRDLATYPLQIRGDYSIFKMLISEVLQLACTLYLYIYMHTQYNNAYTICM